MKTRATLLLSAASVALFLSSCSMNRDAANATKLNSSKLQASQQLTNHHSAPQLALVPQSVPQTTDNQVIASEDNATAKVMVSEKHSNLKTAKQFAKVVLKKNTGKNLAQMVKFSKAASTLDRLANTHTNTASYKSVASAQEVSFLALWLLSILACIVFFILAAVATLSLNVILAFLFYLLAVLASIAALVFFILWIIQLVNG